MVSKIYKNKNFKKIALIFGISGQDGSYLAHLLLRKKYKVIGITRNNKSKNLFRLDKLKIKKKVIIYKCKAIDINFLNKLIKKYKNISEIYYLAGQSSVTFSFTNSIENLQSNVISLVNILEIVKKNNKKIKVFNAVSGQIYGNRKNNIFNEKSYIDPQSPYGVSKASSFWLTKIFRENHGVKCCSGILFNHESPLRSNEFVTKKIINHCKLIKKGKLKYLFLGKVNIYRDWGWAPEYVEAMYLMIRQKHPKDLVIGSGKRHSLRSFVYEVFRLLKIPKNRLKVNTKKLMRKKDVKSYRANPKLAKKILKWEAKTSFKKIIRKMIYDELF